MQQQSNQLCILLRIGNFFLALTLFQLSLTISYLITFYIEMIEIASWIQIWLAALIITDLSIKYMSEKGEFWRRSWNLIDVATLFIVIGSIFLTCSHIDSVHRNNSTVFGAVIVILRYSVQIYRVISLIRASKQIREQQKYNGMISLKPEIEHELEVGEIIQFHH